MRRASGRHEEPFRDNGFGNPFAQDGERDTPFCRLANRLAGNAIQDGDAFVREIPRQRGADLGLHLRKEASAANERYLDTSAGKHLGEFDTDIADRTSTRLTS